MTWNNAKKYCLDFDAFGSEEWIEDSKLKGEEILNNEEIERNKEKNRQATDKQHLFKLLPSSSSQPVNPKCNQIRIARKVSSPKRGRKSLEGLYDTICERASIVKTPDSTVTIRVPGTPDTEVHKADLAKFGTPEQRNTPLE